jgi:hypothetical protein
MFNDENFDLTREEASLLAALPREMVPGDLLEKRVIRALRDEGHFGGAHSRTSRGVSLAWKIAAAITLFAGGVVTGRYASAPEAPATSSITAPVTEASRALKDAPRNDTRPVQQTETVVAEREMWL